MLFFSVFRDKPFVEEDLDLALSLFEGVSPFLLIQILSLPMEQWKYVRSWWLQSNQLAHVLRQWARGEGRSAAMWSVLVEALIELGLRDRAQTACTKKSWSQDFITTTVAIVYKWFVLHML